MLSEFYYLDAEVILREKQKFEKLEQQQQRFQIEKDRDKEKFEARKLYKAMEDEDEFAKFINNKI